MVIPLVNNRKFSLQAKDNAMMHFTHRRKRLASAAHIMSQSCPTLDLTRGSGGVGSGWVG